MINLLATSVIGTIDAKILMSLGLGFVTYSGFNLVLDYAKNYLFTAFESMPVHTLQIMGLLGVDQFISLIFSGWSTVFLIRSFRVLRFF